MKSKKDTKRKKVEILIVEDSPTQACKLQYLLEENNYDVSVAQNGVEALTILKKFNPAIIISDIVMPEMDGFTLCKNVKTDENLKDIPVILLTALSEPGDIVKGLECGADNFVTKPYGDEFILKRIQYVIINHDLRKARVSEIGIDLFFSGKKHFITSDRMQILDLLISTYDSAVQKSRELDITHKKLEKTHEELKELNEQLEQKVVERTQKITQLNSLISAVRNVNQLIAMEKDRDRLLKGTCECFSEIQGFNHAWIALIDESGKLVCTAETGLGKKFQPIVKLLKSGKLPACTQKALAQPEVVFIKDDSDCKDCFLAGYKGERGTMSIRLEHQGKVYGLLTISLPVDAVKNEDEQNLIIEVAGDIAFGLYSMGLEEKRKRAEEALKKRTYTLGERVKELNCLYSISKLVEEGEITLEEIFQGVVDLIHPSWQYPEITCARIIIDKKEYRTDNFKETKWKQTTDILVKGEKIGSLVVCYLEEKPEIDEGPFLKEERNLINAIVERLGKIIERKRGEETLRKNESKYRTLVENIPQKIFLKDKNLVYISCNENYARDLKIKSKEITGKDDYEFYPKEFAEKYRTDDKRIMKSKKTEELDERYIQDGQEYWIHTIKTPVTDDKGNVIGILGIFWDITESKLKEKELIRLQTAIEQTAESIVITDSDGTTQYVNPAFEKTTGYTREEAIGQNPRILKSGKHDEAFYKMMWDTISGGKMWKGHFINKKKDGTFYEEEASISPIIDSTGKITNYVVVRRDVTDELKIENRLREAQKMEAIGTLAGGIAHDFNNILSSVIGYTELSLDSVSKETQLYSDLEKVLRAGRRARDLVNQILAFSRERERERKPIQISPIIKEALKLLRASLPSTIEIHQNIEQRLGTVLGDPTQIHQIIMNLCTNAGQAMSEKGGILEVNLVCMEADSVFASKHPGIIPGHYLKLTVCDTGYGMEPDVIERIFDPYFTTKEKSGGTGLGLATVHGIVTSYGGTITVYSEPGKGSNFNVYLPVTTDEQVIETDLTESLPTGTERILYIDDEPDIVDMGKRILGILGYEVIIRTSSIEALELFRAKPNHFNLIITDMTMPKMTGIELAEELINIRPDIPIILCTGFSEKITEENAKDKGIRAYLMKPLLKIELAKAVRRVLDQETEDL